MTYRRDPVPENIDDIRRFIDSEYRKLEDETDFINEWLATRDAIRVEQAVLRGSTTLTVPTLTDYTDVYIPPESTISANPQEITADKTAGTITIGESGVYTISAYVAQSAGNNNNNYAWAVMSNETIKFILGTTVWTQQANAFTFSAEADFLLIEGDVMRIDTIDTLTGITVVGSNLNIEMKVSAVNNPQSQALKTVY